MDGEMRIEHPLAGRFAVRRACRRAERQFGVIARWQLLEMGCTRSQVEHWRKAGRLHLRYPGVYAWGRPGLPVRGELGAALLYAGGGAALAGITVLWWMDLLHRRPDLIHVDAPGRKASRQDISIRHPVELRRDWHRGLPVVPLPQALLTATRALRHDSLRLVLARAEFQHLLSLPSLNATLTQGGRGTRALRAAMDAHLPQLARCANGFEREFVLLCERRGLPLPEPNPRIGRFRPDMLWREARLIVELDGRDAHTTAAQLAADERRQAELERLGFTVLRVTWAELRHEPDRVAERVRAYLGRC